MRAYALGLLALNLLTLIWGTTFVVVKGAVAEIPQASWFSSASWWRASSSCPFSSAFLPGPWAPAWNWPSGSF
jgi:drug/metabolite transporter (DMT)-like permease